MGYRNHLKGARGLGSAKSGVHHWWMQRVSALGLVPLNLWFALNIAFHVDSSYYDLLLWSGYVWNSVLLSLLVVLNFYHMYLGLQIVIEDYVHGSVWKIFLLLSVRLVCAVSIILGLLSILHLSL